jgi:hypothetical protein
MKNHVKSLENFINEAAIKVHSTANGTAAIPTTSTGADSEDEIIPLAKQAPVLNFGTWAQNITNVQPNNAYPDALLAQAAMHGMTPQEYLAYYGHSTDGHDK